MKVSQVLLLLLAAVFLCAALVRHADAQFCPAGSTQVQNGYSIMCQCPDGSFAGIQGCRMAAPPQSICPADYSYCATSNQCCGTGSYCSHYGCTPIDAVECGTYYCQSGQKCAIGRRQCLAADVVDCGPKANTTCPQGHVCWTATDDIPGAVRKGEGYCPTPEDLSKLQAQIQALKEEKLRREQEEREAKQRAEQERREEVRRKKEERKAEIARKKQEIEERRRAEAEDAALQRKLSRQQQQQRNEDAEAAAWLKKEQQRLARDTQLRAISENNKPNAEAKTTASGDKENGSQPKYSWRPYSNASSPQSTPIGPPASPQNQTARPQTESPPSAPQSSTITTIISGSGGSAAQQSPAPTSPPPSSQSSIITTIIPGTRADATSAGQLITVTGNHSYSFTPTPYGTVLIADNGKYVATATPALASLQYGYNPPVTSQSNALTRSTVSPLAPQQSTTLWNNLQSGNSSGASSSGNSGLISESTFRTLQTSQGVPNSAQSIVTSALTTTGNTAAALTNFYQSNSVASTALNAAASAGGDAAKILFPAQYNWFKGLGWAGEGASVLTDIVHKNYSAIPSNLTEFAGSNAASSLAGGYSLAVAGTTISAAPIGGAVFVGSFELGQKFVAPLVAPWAGNLIFQIDPSFWTPASNPKTTNIPSSTWTGIQSPQASPFPSVGP